METQMYRMKNAGNVQKKNYILIVMGDRFLIVGEESYKYQKEEI